MSVAGQFGGCYRPSSVVRLFEKDFLPLGPAPRIARRRAQGCQGVTALARAPAGAGVPRFPSRALAGRGRYV